MADAIVKATEKYFREAGNRHIAIKLANCRSVISQLLRQHNTFAVFPFCYLAVCCIGGGRMRSALLFANLNQTRTVRALIQTMGDRQYGPPLTRPLQGLHYPQFGFTVQICGDFVQQ